MSIVYRSPNVFQIDSQLSINIQYEKVYSYGKSQSCECDNIKNDIENIDKYSINEGSNTYFINYINFINHAYFFKFSYIL